MRKALQRALNVIIPIALGAGIVGTALPRSVMPEGLRDPHDAVASALRVVSLSQSWRMYAPGPSRAHAYLRVEGERADGSKYQLRENAFERDGWGTAWFWNKDRGDIWRHQVGGRKVDEPDRNRTWYLRGMCVREWRSGEEPISLVMTQVKRGFRPPSEVRKGKSVLKPAKVKDAETVSCRAGTARRMIEEDRNRGQ